PPLSTLFPYTTLFRSARRPDEPHAAGMRASRDPWLTGIVSPVPARTEVLEIDGREVTITNPDKVFFRQAGHSKLDVVRYYLAVAEGALRGVSGRPMALKRFVNGAEGEFFFQKRAPESRPDWVETVELSFPSGRTAREVVVSDAAQL